MSRGRWRRRPGHGRRVRFAQAVPRYRDRRELRRSLRVVARAVRAEQKQQMREDLARLAQRRVAVARVRTGPEGDEIVEFVDGTRLHLDVRSGGVVLQRLARRSPRQAAYLGHVEPRFGHCWYQLYFFSPNQEGVEVLGRIDRFESAEAGFRRTPRRRQGPPRGEQAGGGQP